MRTTPSSALALCFVLAFNGPAAACTDYAQQLATMREADQAMRAQLDAGPEVSRRLGNALDAVDQGNTGRLKSLLKRCGWPLASRHGAAASADAWLLVQHADRDRAFQRAVLPLLEAAVKAGEARGGDFAYLSDRLAVAEGRPQPYGTQFKSAEPCKPVLAPIDSREAVNARRRTIPGMPTLEAYEQMMREHVRQIPACPSAAPSS